MATVRSCIAPWGWDGINRISGFPICKPYGTHTGSDAPRTPKPETVDETQKLTQTEINNLWIIIRREWNLRGGYGKLEIGDTGMPQEIVQASDINKTIKTLFNIKNYDMNNYPHSPDNWDNYFKRKQEVISYGTFESASYGGNDYYCVLGVSRPTVQTNVTDYFESGSPYGTVKYSPWGNEDLATNAEAFNDAWQKLFTVVLVNKDIVTAKFYNTFLAAATQKICETCVCNCNYCSCFGDEVCSCHVVRRYGWCYAYLY